MGNRRISTDLKESALLLWNQGWDLDQICAMYGAYFKEHGNLDRPPSPICGQSLHILTWALMTACKQLFSEESDLYLDEVITWLAHVHGIHISKSTLKNELTWARHYGRAMAGQRALLSDVYMAADVMEGSFDGLLFCEFIATKVLPYMNPFPAERSVLVLNNC
ncbi:hypothetical protein EV363DRAFT_1164953 [Boletus edulis]|nr:hypothetical protein EV363DRAFT_1164953 [Boletus edulis]